MNPSALEGAHLSSLIRHSDRELLTTKQSEIDSTIRQKKEAIMNIDPDTASEEDMRKMLKLLMDERRDRQAAEKEPLGIDGFEGLPVYLDKPECTRCRPFRDMIPDTDPKLPMHRVCHDCAQPIPHNQETGNNGFESVTVDHLHIHTVSGSKGVQVRIPAKRELCIPCYRIDFQKVYPETPCPF